jgi:hypothetical protein
MAGQHQSSTPLPDQRVDMEARFSSYGLTELQPRSAMPGASSPDNT